MYTYKGKRGVEMARISVPRLILEYLWKQELGDRTFPYISRAYYRQNGKFIPYGWHLDDRRGNVLTFTDGDVEGIPFSVALKSR